MEFKNTLKIIGISLLGVLGVGLSCFSGAYGMMMINSYQCASAYSVNENQESVTFTKEELNNCSYPYLATLLNVQDYPSVIEELDCYYNGLYGAFTDLIVDDYLSIAIGDDYSIHFELENTTGIFYLYNSENTQIPFEYNLQINSSWFTENMQKSTTLSANQLNNNTYTYFAEYVNEDAVANDFFDSYIIYNNDIYNFDEYSNGDHLKYTNSNDDAIMFNLGGLSYIGYYWSLNEDLDTNFTNSITIYSTYIADNLYAPYQPMSLLETIVGLLTGGITGIASGVGSGVSTLVSDIFIQANALSVFGGILVVFAGVSLAIGLCRWIMNFLTSLGAKK